MEAVPARQASRYTGFPLDLQKETGCGGLELEAKELKKRLKVTSSVVNHDLDFCLPPQPTLPLVLCLDGAASALERPKKERKLESSKV